MIQELTREQQDAIDVLASEHHAVHLALREDGSVDATVPSGARVRFDEDGVPVEHGQNRARLEWL